MEVSEEGRYSVKIHGLTRCMMGAWYSRIKLGYFVRIRALDLSTRDERLANNK